MLDGLKRISAALGMLAATATAPGLALADAPSPNQRTADAVAATLRTSEQLRGYRIDIEAREGQVTLSGVVANPTQHAEAMARAQRVLGVATVVDRLQVRPDGRVRPAQYSEPMTAGSIGQPPSLSALSRNGGNPGAMMTPDPNRMAFGGGGLFHRGGGGGYADGGMVDGGMAGGAMMPEGPLPEGPAGMAGATQAAVPGYPNYAWPSYAPYPNFSAVGYPTAYPWQAWPNIGPFYPYPEVPLDWRAVTLRWDDGIWWLDFRKNYTRPFFTPYPFGIAAY